MRRAIVAVHAIHHPPFALGYARPGVGCRKHRFRAIGVPLLHPRNDGARRVRGHVFDVAQVHAVNPGQVRQRILPTQVQHQHRLRLGVLLVIGKGRLHQQLFSDKPRRRVAALANLPRRPQVLHWRRNRRRIAMECNLDKLLGAVHLGRKIRLRARPNVTVHARHMGMR